MRKPRAPGVLLTASGGQHWKSRSRERPLSLLPARRVETFPCRPPPRREPPEARWRCGHRIDRVRGGETSPGFIAGSGHRRLSTALGVAGWSVVGCRARVLRAGGERQAASCSSRGWSGCRGAFAPTPPSGDEPEGRGELRQKSARRSGRKRRDVEPRKIAGNSVPTNHSKSGLCQKQAATITHMACKSRKINELAGMSGDAKFPAFYTRTFSPHPCPLFPPSSR